MPDPPRSPHNGPDCVTYAIVATVGQRAPAANEPPPFADLPARQSSGELVVTLFADRGLFEGPTG